jgi:putative transposase
VHRSDKDAVLSAAIQGIIDESSFNDNYGVPRMQMALALRGHKVGIRKLKRIMLDMGLIHERRRRPKGLTKATTDDKIKNI